MLPSTRPSLGISFMRSLFSCLTLVSSFALAQAPAAVQPFDRQQQQTHADQQHAGELARFRSFAQLGSCVPSVGSVLSGSDTASLRQIVKSLAD